MNFIRKFISLIKIVLTLVLIGCGMYFAFINKQLVGFNLIFVRVDSINLGLLIIITLLAGLLLGLLISSLSNLGGNKSKAED